MKYNINNIIQEEVTVFFTESIYCELEDILTEWNNDSVEELLLNGSLNEAISWGDIKRLVNKVGDKKSFLNKAIGKFNNVTNQFTKKYLAKVIIMTMLFLLPSINMSSGKANALANEFAKEQTIDAKKAHDAIIKQMQRQEFADPTQMSTSEEGKNLIKQHEKLRLKGYTIGDGKVTIGWGHAEPIGKSKYQIDQVITKEEANQLFEQDIAFFEEGIRRMFRQWAERGNKPQINQNMFDALVSIAFNTGISGLRNTEFAEKLEHSTDPMEVAELIKTTRLKKGYSGLEDRREDEYNLFVKANNAHNSVRI